MSFDACAELVRKGDRDRFMTTLAAPADRRGPLLALYAFNLEVARAPWQTAEPLIAGMRLQFWADAVAGAESGQPPPGHPVAAPLAGLIREGRLPAADLLALIEARRFDVGRAPHPDQAALLDYLAATSGGLTWMAARLLGAGPDDEGAIRRFGRAAGVARILAAEAELAAAGRPALPDRRDGAIRGLAGRALDDLGQARRNRPGLPKSILAAMLTGWQAEPLLKRAVRKPALVREGGLRLSEFSRRRLLAWRALSGRW